MELSIFLLHVSSKKGHVRRVLWSDQGIMALLSEMTTDDPKNSSFLHNSIFINISVLIYEMSFLLMHLKYIT